MRRPAHAPSQRGQDRSRRGRGPPPAVGFLPGGDRAHPLGDARGPHASQCPSPRRLRGEDRRHPQRHHREPRGAARASGGSGPRLSKRDRYGGHPPPDRGVPQGGTRLRGRVPQRCAPARRRLWDRSDVGGRPGGDLRRAPGQPHRPRAGEGQDIRGERPRPVGGAHAGGDLPRRRGDRSYVPKGSRQKPSRGRPSARRSSRSHSASPTSSEVASPTSC
jgi:hypothetical protein